MSNRFPFAIVANAMAAADPELRAAVLRLREEGHRIEVLPTWEDGDGVRLAREAASRGHRLVFAAGGDGTLNEVASGILSTRGVAVGILPFGTGNDFATATGAPMKNPLLMIRSAIAAPERKIDVMTVDGRVVVNAVTGGFPATLTHGASTVLKSAFGRLAYLVNGLKGLGRIQSHRVRIRAPGFKWDGKLLALAIGNGRRAGGGVVFAPEAVLDDGLADVLVVPEQPLPRVVAGVGGIIRSRLPHRFRGMVSLRVPWLSIESARPMHFSLDGGPFSAAKARFRVRPRCLSLRLRSNPSRR